MSQAEMSTQAPRQSWEELERTEKSNKWLGQMSLYEATSLPDSVTPEQTSLSAEIRTKAETLLRRALKLNKDGALGAFNASRKKDEFIVHVETNEERREKGSSAPDLVSVIRRMPGNPTAEELYDIQLSDTHTSTVTHSIRGPGGSYMAPGLFDRVQFAADGRINGFVLETSGGSDYRVVDLAHTTEMANQSLSNIEAVLNQVESTQPSS